MSDEAGCLQDDAYCNPLPDGTYCTGPASADSCPEGSFPVESAVDCPEGTRCFSVSASLRCLQPTWTVAACEAVGGSALADPGDGSLQREGCPEGTVLLGSIDADWDEVGLCCSSGSVACRPQHAYGIGQCEQPSRYRWNGTDCVTLDACSCVGPDCEDSYATEEACMTTHGVCMDGFVRCAGLGQCAAGEYCDYLPGMACGILDRLATCKTRPTSCPTLEPPAPVCGCDSITYPSVCDAAKQGMGVISDGACQSAP